ncbi:MAG: NADH-quinone oxidoreductase subunit M [Chromatiales bacterium]|jgi:NADH-quinone oxidoreductase subunit M
MPSLSYLLLTPFVGALAILLLPSDQVALVRPAALIASTLTLLLSWIYIGAFDPAQPGLQFLQTAVWHTRLGTSFALALDGFSYPMVLLATLLCFVALLASAGIRKRIKGYYSLVLLLETAMLGVFMAQDWLLFYVFWELTLIPLFFLIDRWGGGNRHGAALNFVLYTMGGSVFMLISLLWLFDAVPGHSFSMIAMAESGRGLSQHTQILLFLGLLIGFGVKMPIFPLHGWLPLAHVEAPSPISILLSGILLKMGAYGLIRAAAALPEAVLALQDLLATLAFISLLYGGLLAWRNRDLKAMIAYSSVSHMGVVLLGIAALNLAGLHGALMQMVAHGLVAASLFLLIGLLYERTQTRDVTQYSSLVRVTPRFAFFTTLAFIAAISLPGTAGFVAELNTLIGSFARWGWVAALLTLGVLLSAAYAIRSISQLFTGPVRPAMHKIEDLRPVELIAAGTLAAGTLLLGFMPGPLLGLMNSSAAQLSGLFTP